MTELVAVDIGGTHARFALASVNETGAISLGESETLRTENHASFQTAWEHFRELRGGSLPEAVSMAIAGPVEREVIRFTNNPWTIQPKLLKGQLGVERSTILNDFAAVAHAVARADDDEFVYLAGPEGSLPARGTLSVLGPGTGLGVSHLWRDGAGRYRVQATEGGHVDFAPLDAIDDALLARLRKRHMRVSVERVVSGPAIVDIYQTLAALEGRTVRECDDVQIWTLAASGQDSLATAAVDRFCQSLGSIAGDMALAHGASGVVISGGLGYRIRDTLLASGFAERFQAKGRFAQLMTTIPVKLMIHPQPGLFGAAAAFALEHS